MGRGRLRAALPEASGQQDRPQDRAAQRRALQILNDLERIDGNPFVIPGLKKGTHRSSLQPLWERIREQAGIEDVRIHDPRYTFASFGVNAGLNLPVIGRLLGHSKTATTERYAHLADDPVRKATETIGATIAASLSGKPKAEVRILERPSAVNQ